MLTLDQVIMGHINNESCYIFMPPILEKLKGHIAYDSSVRYRTYQDTVLKFHI